MKKSQVKRTTNILRGIVGAGFLPNEQKQEMLSNIDKMEKSYIGTFGTWLCIECQHEINKCPVCENPIAEKHQI